jgi:hypothetical protein
METGGYQIAVARVWCAAGRHPAFNEDYRDVAWMRSRQPIFAAIASRVLRSGCLNTVAFLTVKHLAGE